MRELWFRTALNGGSNSYIPTSTRVSLFNCLRKTVVSEYRVGPWFLEVVDSRFAMLLLLVAVLTQCSLQFKILILFAYDVGVLVKCHQSGFYRTCSKLSIRQTFSFQICFHLCGYFCVC